MDELRRLNKKLAGLLEDAEPGCHTWRFAMAGTIVEMLQYAGFGEVTQSQLIECGKDNERLTRAFGPSESH